MTPAPDGTPLANYVWPAAPNVAPPIAGPGTPSIYLLHGLSEHAGRYDRLARWLAARGWAVGAHDHRGHGRSGGRPATLSREDDLVMDAVDRLHAWTRQHGRPPILLGHSLGALVAVRIALRRMADIDGLVLSSPPFVVHVPPWVRRTLTWMSLHAPDLRVPHGLAPARISHDPAVVKAYRSDPLVRRHMTGRLARFVDEGGRESLREAPLLACRTLLMVAGDDSIVAAEGSRQFAQRAPAELLTLRWYDTAWHEIFNETAPIADPVYADLDEWLARTAQALSLSPVLAPSAQEAGTP
ncbi:alpha/beta hydrolase [Achromobacter insolitus]|jgi:alpha-beta hydrolase superfamily lysophospholipase|uniref:Monoacylglycerol lipase n=7 Tax=Achromobacter insolitus TaxID=217204 RepID=A0A6S7FJ01_9BURK|nr:MULTISPECIES: alpha/beta hydrolase [Achromobacter]MCP1400819.1 alpha-beta hydrolase superfamily lysophospholipase [Achromobacter insolitus]MEB3095227.1 alpha/beta hydrolase [Achromobacter sp. D10]OAD17719.1 hydrolase [Achromobacter insolitus]WKK18150.1 alpha/beta hydrolase [Achromobacter insolitus]CAB3932443.1 Monoacylglycerol lipase [Achromobacter insolitus]